MHLEGTVAKQLGWEMKDGILVTKAVADPVSCVCDECGFVADAVVGAKCPECKTGAMKAKGKEKAIEVRVVSKGDVPGHEFHGNQHTGGGSSGTDPNKSPEAQQERERTAIRTRLEIDSLGSKLGRFQNNIRNDVKVSSEAIRGLRDKAAEVRETMRGISIANQNSNRAEEYRSDLAMAESVLEEADALLDEVGEKSLKAASLPCTCDECGAEADCAPGSTCQEPDCDGTMVVDKKEKGGAGSGNFGHSGRPGERGGSGEGGGGSPSGSSETSIVNQKKQTDAAWRASKASDGSPKGEERAAQAHDRAAVAASAVVKNPPKNLAEFGDEGYTIEHYEAQVRTHESQAALHRARAKEPASTDEQRRAGESFFGKSFEHEIKVVRPAPSVKVLFVPPSSSEIAQRVGVAVEKALSRRTGRIL